VKLRVLLIATAGLLITVGGFVVLHTGAPGDAACERSRFVPSFGLSAWPPGVRCEYGEPVQTDVIVNGWFALVVVAAAVTFVVAAPRSTRARST
jgi:hypothetical protein